MPSSASSNSTTTSTTNSTTSDSEELLWLVQKNRKITFVFGPQELEQLSGLDGWNMLVSLGVDVGYLLEKLRAGKQFRLVLFESIRDSPNCNSNDLLQQLPSNSDHNAPLPATWDNVMHIVSRTYPLLQNVLYAHLNYLKQNDLGFIEQNAGFRFLDVDRAGPDDPRFMTYERFLQRIQLGSSVVTPIDTRLFLYCEVRLLDLFRGDGFTYHAYDLKKGIHEFVMMNQKLADLLNPIAVDLNVRPPSSLVADFSKSLSPKKRILITNDDGITAPGLIAIAEALVQTEKYEICVASPASQQSGVSHHFTIHTPLYVEEYQIPTEILQEIPALRVEGTPADCVKLAITTIYGKPDIVVSGINRGQNCGHNALYSGTCAAALEAAINNCPAIAVSLDFGEVGPKRHDFDAAAELVLPVIEAALLHGLPPATVLNVNVPNLPHEQIKGIKLTRQGFSGFRQTYEQEPIEEDSPEAQPGHRAQHSHHYGHRVKIGRRLKFHLKGHSIISDPSTEIDTAAMSAGFVSVSIIGLLFKSPAEIPLREQMEHQWGIFHP